MEKPLNFETAIDFIKRHGDANEQARLQYALYQQKPSPRILSGLLKGQRQDGGWAPFWAPDYSSLDATCFRLAQVDQAGIPNTNPGVVRAIQFLANRQNNDGSWEEGASVATDAPPWVKPGELQAGLYLTANCGFWLAILGGPGANAARAADFLSAFLGENGRLPTFLHTHWLAGGLWYHLERFRPARRVFGYLLSAIDEMTASNLAWLVLALTRAGVPPGEKLIRHAATRLQTLQKPEGYWESEDGSARSVHTTLEALQAIRMCESTD